MQSISPADHLLVKSYINGDESSFEILLKRHKD